MGSIDSPRTPDDGAGHAGPPELVTVGRRNGWRPALLVVVVVGCLLGVAVWKPWEGGLAPAGTGHATVPPGAAGGLLPAITSAPGTTDAPAPTASPSPVTFARLDLAILGTFDPPAAWGVAVAYVSRTQFDDAALGGSPTVTPVVSWESIEPGRRAPGPTLDQPDVTSVAVAATWPLEMRPLAIRLVSFGPPHPTPLSRPGSSPARGLEVALGTPLATLVRPEAGASAASGLVSGAFFLPSPTRSGDPAGWLGNGWPTGAYAFEVELEAGLRVTLPFTIGASAAP